MYYVYFDDANFFGGAVTYQVTTVKEQALETAGRLYVGSIVTPAAGAPDTIGNNDGGSGAQSGASQVVWFQAAAGVVAGNGVVSNPGQSIDGNPSDYAAISVSGNGSLNQATLNVSLPVPLGGAYSKVTLVILRSIPTNSLSSAASPNGYNAYLYINGVVRALIDSDAAGGGTQPDTQIVTDLTSYLIYGALQQFSLGFEVQADHTIASGALTVNVPAAYLVVET